MEELVDSEEPQGQRERECKSKSDQDAIFPGYLRGAYKLRLYIISLLTRQR